MQGSVSVPGAMAVRQWHLQVSVVVAVLVAARLALHNTPTTKEVSTHTKPQHGRMMRAGPRDSRAPGGARHVQGQICGYTWTKPVLVSGSMVSHLLLRAVPPCPSYPHHSPTHPPPADFQRPRPPTGLTLRTSNNRSHTCQNPSPRPPQTYTASLENTGMVYAPPVASKVSVKASISVASGAPPHS